MRTEEVLKALREHDNKILDRATTAPASLVADIEQALPELDDEARELAVMVIVRHNRANAGPLLLRMTGDKSPEVAAVAAQNLDKVTNVLDVGAILAALQEREDEYIRSQLYLAVGRAMDTSKLEALRALARREQNPDAALDAQAAAVKLGGQPERADLLERTRTAEPDKAIAARDHLLYIGDPKLAKGLIPWLSNKAGVIRLGSDRKPGMVRMCDVAVWTAHLLGVKFLMQPDYLTNFDDSIIANAAAAIKSMPD